MAELRLRTALELHDGILQVLTGASLQIAVARKLVRSDPAAAERVLELLASSIAAEQQEMRLYVDELKGSPPTWTDGSLALPVRIRAALDRLAAVWGLGISLETHNTRPIGGELGRQILRLIQEATVNAARHAAATAVSVSLAMEDADVAIAVTNDGKGFAFLGEYDHDTLKSLRMGPLSLRHRVEEAGGSMAIHSTPSGSTVMIRLPLPRGGDVS